jgi:hypothetical protein
MPGEPTLRRGSRGPDAVTQQRQLSDAVNRSIPNHDKGHVKAPIVLTSPPHDDDRGRARRTRRPKPCGCPHTDLIGQRRRKAPSGHLPDLSNREPEGTAFCRKCGTYCWDDHPTARARAGGDLDAACGRLRERRREPAAAGRLGATIQ